MIVRSPHDLHPAYPRTRADPCCRLLFRSSLSSAVQVEPVGTSDWEVVEMNAGHLEVVMLQQVGAPLTPPCPAPPPSN